MTEHEPSSRTFSTRLDIAASRDAVWKAISNDAELRRWFAPEARIEDRVGGEVLWTWGDHHRWAQRIEILEPGRRLKTRYDSAVDDGAGGKRPLFIDFVLEGEGGTTTLRLVQSGFGKEAGFDGEYDGIRRGWPVELQSLKLYLEEHRGRERRLAWSTRDLDLDPAEGWKRLTSAEGFACGPDVESLRPGRPFRIESADGDVFSGTTLVCQPREFTGNATSHQGFLRLSVERWAGKSHVWCWLGSYERSAAELHGLQERWDAMLERLFVPASSR